MALVAFRRCRRRPSALVSPGCGHGNDAGGWWGAGSGIGPWYTCASSHVCVCRTALHVRVLNQAHRCFSQGLPKRLVHKGDPDASRRVSEQYVQGGEGAAGLALALAARRRRAILPSPKAALPRAGSECGGREPLLEAGGCVRVQEARRVQRARAKRQRQRYGDQRALAPFHPRRPPSRFSSVNGLAEWQQPSHAMDGHTRIHMRSVTHGQGAV